MASTSAAATHSNPDRITAAVFPNASPIVSLMASFAAFAAGYLARPIGSNVLKATS